MKDPPFNTMYEGFRYEDSLVFHDNLSGKPDYDTGLPKTEVVRIKNA